MGMNEVVSWDTIRISLGARGVAILQELWYQNAPFTRHRGNILAATFTKYPLGQNNIKTWAKRTVRQLFENTARRQGYAIKTR